MTLRDFKLIGELPTSKKPWHIMTWNGMVVLANEHHAPLIVVDGKLETLRPQYPGDADNVRQLDTKE